MTYYAGLDVSLKEVSICVVDAEGLAQLARTGWYTPVHVRSEEADRLRTLLGARERLIKLRVEIEAHVRGVLKTFGIRLGGVTYARNRQSFRDDLAAACQGGWALSILADGFIAVHETVCRATVELSRDLRAIAQENPVSRRLMTIPGVGPIVSLNFVTLADDPARFRRVADVGAFLGLTPRRYQSGDTDYSGRISKCGDAVMRGVLIEAAGCVIGKMKRFSRLRSWAIGLAARKGGKKAMIGTARKLAVLMLAFWKNGTDCQWAKEEATA
ncbi:MAG: IS110 family transposase [Pseudomonadota bacterium]